MRRAVVAFVLALAAVALVGGGRAAASAPPCPSTPHPPDPNRPKVALTFNIGAHHRTVSGTEHVVFTPDLPITQLVFRLTANSSYIVKRGSHVTVTSASASPGGRPMRFVRAAAASSTQGGLLEIPFAHTIPAGTSVTADIAFTVYLGGAYYERFGRSGDFAWFGSAQPLLAWERGIGWHTEDMIPFPAESATSEAMDTTITVITPAADKVVMTGDPTTSTPLRTKRVWRAHATKVRDVSVAVGPFYVSDTTVGSTRLRVGAYTSASRAKLVPEFTRAIKLLAAKFGHFPYASLAVARVPGHDGGGIEYPAMIQMQSEVRSDIVHETAHQWFYGMVGDSQSQHPWLDEAFAEYAERLVDNHPEPTSYLHASGTVDRSIQSYGTNEDAYFFVTYAKGAAALEAARRVAGASGWDHALRCYVNVRAWRIVHPGQFEQAIARYPKAIAVLRDAGALRR